MDNIKWNKPNELMPKDDNMVLIKVTGNKAFAGYYHERGYWIIIARNSSYRANKTHKVIEWAYKPDW